MIRCALTALGRSPRAQKWTERRLTPNTWASWPQVKADLCRISCSAVCHGGVECGSKIPGEVPVRDTALHGMTSPMDAAPLALVPIGAATSSH